MHLGDTIIAVSSPPGRGPRGLIRLSGPEAHAHLALPAERFGTVRLHLSIGELPALALRFDKPRSYTGEDVLELILPGNPDLLERVVDHFVDLGLRRAEPGEFTARAYFNGKMTLSQAEGVAQTIAAESDAQLAAAKQLLSGRLGTLAAELAEEVAMLLALVEAGVDFVEEEDVVAIEPEVFLRRARPIRAVLAAQLARAVGVEHLSDAPWVVLLGPANAGKSTLFNALLGRTRAVESSIAGATRDVLVEPLLLPSGGEVMLVDLAGVGADVDRLMRRAAEARTAAMQRAELVIECFPSDAEPNEAQRWLRAAERRVGASVPRLCVRTKCDLRQSSRGREGAVAAGTSVDSPGQAPPLHGENSAASALVLSAKSGVGLPALLDRIEARLRDRASSLAADALALAPRQEKALRRAEASLTRAIELVEKRVGQRALANDELVAGELREGLDALGEIVGEITPDEVLGRVFATFCVGK
jgi:tRNA modification GTPase